MNPEEIKVGETYNVRLQVSKKETYGIKAIAANAHDLTNPIEHLFEPREFPVFSPISPAPKYDPYRKFRKGDKVRVVKRHGRETPLASVMQDLSEKTFTVIADEDEDNDVLIDTSKGNRFIQFSHLELVTPVEELEPYSVNENEHSKSYEVLRGHPVRVCAAYYYGGECPAYTKEAAKAAAEAERDRLNAEYRKEQK